MFVATVKSTSSQFSLIDDEDEKQPDLAASIHEHFRALAEILGQAAELSGDTVEGERLRLAAVAARRGETSAEKLLAKLGRGTLTESGIRPQKAVP